MPVCWRYNIHKRVYTTSTPQTGGLVPSGVVERALTAAGSRVKETIGESVS